MISFVAPADGLAVDGELQPEVSGLLPKLDPKEVVKQRKQTTYVIKSLPKGLVFDGKSNWFAFKHKFTLYAAKLGGTPHGATTFAEPKSIEQAMNGVKWFQYVHQSMYSDNRRDSQIP